MAAVRKHGAIVRVTRYLLESEPVSSSFVRMSYADHYLREEVPKGVEMHLHSRNISNDLQHQTSNESGEECPGTVADTRI